MLNVMNSSCQESPTESSIMTITSFNTLNDEMLIKMHSVKASFNCQRDAALSFMMGSRQRLKTRGTDLYTLRR